MHRVFITISLLYIGFITYASSPNLNVIRSEFHKAALDPEKIVSFHTYISNIDDNEPILKAYRATSEALMAQITWNPVEKYQQLQKFEELINDAVKNDPDNIEIRFLRFSVEYSIPRFLGASKNLMEDKHMILSNLERVGSLELDPYFTRYILYFLKETNLCEPEYLVKIESTLSKS